MDVKQLSSADFRKHYAHESGVVEVTAYGKVIGTWYPSDCELLEAVALPEPVVATPLPQPRMTIRPVKGPIKQMVGVEQRVIDPRELAALERERYAQLSARMYGPRKPAGGNNGRQ